MKSKIILVVIILAVLGGAFYWFQWRPTQIRKECSKYNSEEIIKARIDKSSFLSPSMFQTYEDCLREHGLEK